MPGVFAGDRVAVLQRGDDPSRNITEIPDRRRYKDQLADAFPDAFSDALSDPGVAHLTSNRSALLMP